MVNFERGARRLSFVVKKKPGGAVSAWLFGDAVDGTRLGVFAPLGHATFQVGQGKHVLCIAGGSGIAGMMSILSLASGAGHFAAWDGHVFFGIRGARDGFFLDELEVFRAQYPERLSVTVALSDEDVPASLVEAYPGFTFGHLTYGHEIERTLHVDLARLLSFHTSRGGSGTVTVVPLPSQYGTIEFDAGGMMLTGNAFAVGSLSGTLAAD